MQYGAFKYLNLVTQIKMDRFSYFGGRIKKIYMSIIKIHFFRE